MKQFQLRRLLSQLKIREDVNLHAVALILTEMKFRGPIFRLCEIVFVYTYGLLHRQDPKVTVGQCQVSISYWRSHLALHKRPLIFAAYDSICNYDVCCLYLRNNPSSSVREMLINYNGKPSTLYVNTFNTNLRRVQSLIGQRTAPSCRASLA